MARLVAIGLVALLVGAVAADAARSPRLERLAIRPADGSAARAAVVRASDLASNWIGGAKGIPDSAPPCGLDFSRLTITGQAASEFGRGGGYAYSLVQFFPTHAQAVADLAAGSGLATARCRARAGAKGSGATVVSVKKMQAPRVGDHTVALEELFLVGGENLYWDQITFVRGRAGVGVVVAGRGSDVAYASEMSRRIAARLPSHS